MEKLSELLGKPVINIFEAQIEGYVKNILLDDKFQKALWLEIFDDENQEEKLVDVKSIYSFNKDAIMLKNSEHIILANTIIQKQFSLVGYKVYSQTGKFIDKVFDIEFDNRLHVKNILLKTQNILDKKLILSIGKNIIIQKENKTTKLSTFAPNKVKTNSATNNLVEIMETEPKQIVVPKKVLTTSFDFLIGRKVGQNLYAENGQLIAKKQSKITSHIIDAASQNGKLKELTTYSLT
ncbi:MAG: hypothetical protein IKR12_03000 [Clostridia bacterium]|nr:hypothetical protein [Clostridia bacterium]